MTRRVLLISANRCDSPDRVFPLGLAQLGAALRQAGHQTRWIDWQVDLERLETVLKDYQPHLVGISVRNIDDVMIHKKETFFGEAGSLCERIRRGTTSPIVLGGSGFSIFPERLLEWTGADFGICGEGEEAIVSLVEGLDKKDGYAAIPGLVYRQDRRVMANPPRAGGPPPLIQSSDRPAHIVRHYLETSGTMNLQTQRGCAFTCCYCTYPIIEGRRHRRRNPEEIAEEMAQLQAAGARFAFIVDSVFNSSALHVSETCEAILKRGLKIRWGCFLRPQGLTADLMALMARAGLSHIEFGSDSFCDDVLAAYGKQLTFDDIRSSDELARQRKMDRCHFLICGGPGETERTLQTGFDNSRALDGSVVMAVIGMRIYPGTRLCQTALEEGRIKPDTDLLSPVYYLAKGLSQEAILARLQEFSRRSPNWIVGEHSPAYADLVRRLRSRGVAGPLWSYFSMIQRLWPQTTPPAT